MLKICRSGHKPREKGRDALFTLCSRVSIKKEKEKKWKEAIEFVSLSSTYEEKEKENEWKIVWFGWFLK